MTANNEIPGREYVLKGSAACAGCGSSLALRLVLKAAGSDTVLVMPASCTAAFQGIWPNTAIDIPVVNIAFGAAAATASGISNAYRAIGKTTNVIVYAGDGGTVDIGLQALSGAFERGTDFLYICYDNEAYGNTGMQRSGATPPGARTTTTPAGKIERKKDIDAIIAAHQPPYQATACSAYPLDLFRKVKKALSFRGPTFIHVLSPCPPGWRYTSEKTIEVGKLAVKTGIWPLYEREHGKLAISGPTKVAMRQPSPLDDYLRLQGRFRDIDPQAIALLEGEVTATLQRLSREGALLH